MRRILYLEPIGGIAGDMFLAAALDLGVSRADLERALSGLSVPTWRLRTSTASRHAISGTHLQVEVDEAAHQGERSLAEIRQLIGTATSMPERARERALHAFALIGEAEARIHDVPVEKIHFHEVGAVDSLVDICGAAVVLELLGNPEVYAAPPPLGSGMVRTAHGQMPVPAPATLELLRDVPVRFEGLGELTTPTGAALLRAFAKIGPPPEMVIERIGYGVGTRDFEDRPNVLRVSLGHPAHGAEAGTFVIEANLDDATPQLLGALMESLLALGALDAYVLPATMKKSRPGHLLGVVVAGDKKEQVVRALLTESTTLGVRMHRVERTAVDRSFETVETPFGSVRVKIGRVGGQVVNAQPEFEDCRELAEMAKVPLKRVIAEALAAYYRR